MSIVACHEIADPFGIYYAIYRISDGYLIYGEQEIVKLDARKR